MNSLEEPQRSKNSQQTELEMAKCTQALKTPTNG